MTNAIVDESVMSAAPAAETVKRMTTAEFEIELHKPEFAGRAFELIDGRMVEKAMPVWKHAKIAGYINILLGYYILERNLGWLVPELRVKLPDNLLNARQPDLAFVSAEHGDQDADSAIEFMPDLIVEVKSDSDTYIDMRHKALFYKSQGAKIVWLIFPQKQTIEVYAADDTIHTLTSADTLTGDDLIPGFSLSVAKIFEANSL